MAATAAPFSSMETFLSSCPLRLFIATRDGELLQWSASLQSLVGRAPEVKSPLFGLLHPEDSGAVAQTWTRLLDSAAPVRAEFRMRDAEHGYRRVACVLRWDAAHELVHGVIEDVPAGAAIDEELVRLRQQEQILKALMDNVSICVWATDRQGTVNFHDGKGLELGGMKRGENLGKNMFEIFGQREDMDQIRHAFEGKMVHTFSEMQGLHWESWVVPIPGESGAIDGLIGFTLDVSDAKRAEQDLRAQIALIEQQKQVIRDLSTPIIEVWDKVLTLPMVGVVDSLRVAEVMEALLMQIVEKGARFAILDLTGVEMVDTQVAGHLISIVNAIRLLGAEGIITGIKPTVAQTMVALGMDMSSVTTLRNLRVGLSHCIRWMARSAEGAPLNAAPAAPAAPAVKAPA